MIVSRASTALLFGLLFALLFATAACGEPLSPSSPSLPTLWSPGFFVVVDADAGTPDADGERRGAVFSFSAPGFSEEGWVDRRLDDERWLDPVDVAFLPAGAPGGDAQRSTPLLLEGRWSPLGGEARGALFALPEHEGQAARLLWSDPRLRQPVALAVGPSGTVYISDRSADPLGLGRPTGCVFALDLAAAAAGRDDAARVEAAGPELVTPGALLFTRDGRLLLMDADANPRGLPPVNGVAATPGELFSLGGVGLESILQPDGSVSPVGLIEGADGTLWLVDANEGSAPPFLGRGALFRVGERGLEKVLDGSDAPERLFIDPTGGVALGDGTLVVADANADPEGRGADGTGRGVYGTGPGCLLRLDPRDGAAEPVGVLRTHPDFVTPVTVRRVPDR